MPSHLAVTPGTGRSSMTDIIPGRFYTDLNPVFIGRKGRWHGFPAPGPTLEFFSRTQIRSAAREFSAAKADRMFGGEF